MNKFCDPDQYSDGDFRAEVSERSTNDLDILTQIANRRKFDEMFTNAIKKAKTTVCYLSILMLKVDYFNDQNKIDEQLARDDYLRPIALTLKNILKRSGDLTARWDDEKFACILSDTDPAGAADMAEKIRKKVVNMAIPNSLTAAVITVSIGVVTSILTDETSYDTLLKNADHALLTAIEMGGNQIYIYKS